MSRYYFHSEDGESVVDEEGTELKDLAAAKDAAVAYLVDSLRHHPERLWDTESFRITVQDETRLTLFTIETSATYAAALGPSRRSASQ